MLKVAICKTCGKEFEYESNGAGRGFSYCSDECARKKRCRRNTEAMIRRYHSDDEFRKRRLRQNVESNRRRREARREVALQKLIDELSSTNDPVEIRKILEEKTRIKAKYYA